MKGMKTHNYFLSVTAIAIGAVLVLGFYYASQKIFIGRGLVDEIISIINPEEPVRLGFFRGGESKYYVPNVRVRIL